MKDITVVLEPCNPYPSPVYGRDFANQLSDGAPDYRRTRWLGEVIGRLSPEQMEDLVRHFANTHPREFEQDLAFFQVRVNESSS